ncbi:WD repeat-containing protein 6 [Coemansia sp. RSA 1935]|nr:WD repeat-containing protein 6 [Coemansia sp. RSA 1935]
MVAAESKAGNVAAIGMRDGTVLLVCGNSIRSAQLHTCSVQWLTVMQRSDNVYDVITVDNSGDIVWSLVTWDASWQAVARIERPTAGMRVASAAVSHEGQWLVIGSATGSVYVYKHGDLKTINGLDAETATLLQVACKWPQAHGRHTVSAVSVDVDVVGNVRIVSGGRDGWVRTFNVLDSVPADAAPDAVCVGDVVLHCTSRVKVTRGWIEQLLCVDGQLLAVTFFRKRLELVDVEAAHIVVSTVCAGGAKLWQVVVGSAGVRIGFVKSGLLRTVCVPLSQSAPIVLATGISATDIRAVCAIDVQIGGRQLCVALLGGEDGRIRIIKCSDMQLDVLENVRRHRSVIRCIQSIPSISLDSDASRFVLSAGAGSELRCWRLNASSGGDTLALVDWALAPMLDDRDIRIMDIAVVHRELSNVWIVAAYSDASVVLWRLDIDHQTFSYAARAASDIHAHCVLSAASVKTNDGRYLVLTGASDGQIIVWDVSMFIAGTVDVAKPNVALQAVLKIPHVHQSGVNTLCAHVNGVDIVVASGGDDCCISLTRIGSTPPSVQSVTRNELAHASAIQGVAFLGGGSICSVSTDQRVAVWNQHLELQDMAITLVSDPSALEVSTIGDDLQIMVAGIGFETFTMSSSC